MIALSRIFATHNRTYVCRRCGERLSINRHGFLFGWLAVGVLAAAVAALFTSRLHIALGLTLAPPLFVLAVWLTTSANYSKRKS